MGQGASEVDLAARPSTRLTEAEVLELSQRPDTIAACLQAEAQIDRGESVRVTREELIEENESSS